MLAVGGNLGVAPGTHLDVGQALGGDVVVGGGVATGSDLDPHGGRVDTGIANATAPYLDLVSQLTPKSVAYGSIPVTGTADVTHHAITLTGDGVSNLQVFTLDGADLDAEGSPRSFAAAARRPAGRHRGREPRRHGGRPSTSTRC